MNRHEQSAPPLEDAEQLGDPLVALELESTGLAKVWEPLVSAGVPPDLLLEAVRSRIAAVSERVADDRMSIHGLRLRAGAFRDADQRELA